MAESSLTLRREDLRRHMARHIGWQIANLDGEKNTWLNDITDSVIREFYHPVPLQGEIESHAWSFLRPKITITTTEAFSDADRTITVAAGVVTLGGTGDTFPTWSAQGELRPTTTGGQYSVAAYDSTT